MEKKRKTKSDGKKRSYSSYRPTRTREIDKYSFLLYARGIVRGLNARIAFMTAQQRAINVDLVRDQETGREKKKSTIKRQAVNAVKASAIRARYEKIRDDLYACVDEVFADEPEQFRDFFRLAVMDGLAKDKVKKKMGIDEGTYLMLERKAKRDTLDGPVERGKKKVESGEE